MTNLKEFRLTTMVPLFFQGQTECRPVQRRSAKIRRLEAPAVVQHARYVVFQMTEVAVPKDLFEKILRLIDGLQPRPSPA
jgi:hypothetical protein